MASPAATTARACSRPGLRESRSIGPETDTAATTRPAGRADRRRDRRDTGLPFGDAGRPALPADPRQCLRGEDGRRHAAMQPFGVLPGQQHLRGRPGGQWQASADRHRVAKTGRKLCRGDAHPDVALPAVELRALAGGVAQLREHRAADRDEPILAALRPPAPRAAGRAQICPRCLGPRGGVARGQRRGDARSVAAGR